MRALRRLRRPRKPAPKPVPAPEKNGPRMCGRGEHELTPEITHTDRSGKDHCRACWAKYGPDIQATG